MLEDRFKQQLREAFLLEPGHVKLILAISGGVDSVVMTDLCARTGFDFIIAHCNFQLRGEESERDEAFVRSLGDKYGKPVIVEKFDTDRFASEQKVSIQEAARMLRYNWFYRLLESGTTLPNEKADTDIKEHADPGDRKFSLWLATAHHANDNIETLLINFFRGTGIAGLHGIPLKQGKIIRPLLFAKREEILDYAKTRQLAWVEDSSNLLDKYTRNFFRHNVLPLISQVYPHVENTLLENIQRFGEAQLLYQDAVNLHLSKLCQQNGNEIHIPILKLSKSIAPRTLIWEAIKKFDFHPAQVNEVVKLMDATNGSYVASPSYRIIKNRKWLIIAPVEEEIIEHIIIEKDTEKLKFGAGVINIERIASPPFEIPSNNQIAMLDAKQLSYPLILRKWKNGDYFYPLGMRKKKKLARFLIDLKVSPTDKEKVWVLESDKKLLWVIGYRIDDRFKITNSTQDAIRISFARI